MARSEPEPEPEQQPMTDDELDQLHEAVEELQAETRQYLADELGGEPDDYRPPEDD